MVKRFVFSLSAVLLVVVVSAGGASATVPAAGWSIDSFAAPTDFSVGQNAECEATLNRQTPLCDSYEVSVRNAGSRATEGPITVTDMLPAGLMVKEVQLFLLRLGGGGFGSLCEPGSVPVRCQWTSALNPDETLRMVVYVTVGPGAAGSLSSVASVTGGGAGEASTNVQNPNGPLPALFGVSAFGSLLTGVDGAPDTQAGAHPYEYTTSIDLDNMIRQSPHGEREDTSVHDVKDIAVDLPLGLVGSALAAPTCTLGQLSSSVHCPPATRIGHIVTVPLGAEGVDSPLWNMVPERGVAAEFGFVDVNEGSHVFYASVAPTPAGYVLRTTSPDIPQVALRRILVSVFGNPAERDESGNAPVALFTNPSDCSGEPLTTSIHMDSWQAPGSDNVDGSPNLSGSNWVSAGAQSPAVTGCDLLKFDASLSVRPEASQAATPSGLSFELRVPQNENPEALATPPLRKTVVVLPAGLAVDPSAAGGLAACSLAQIALGTSVQPSCPEASKIGSVELETPALAGVLQGSVYLAAQNENPFHTLFAGYIVVDDPTTGVLVKVPGRLEPDPMTGQITATVDEIPQFPISDIRLRFFGGPRAPLVTPAACGTYTTNATLTPWSAPDSGPPTTASDSFQIQSGCGGGFSPSFTAGMTNNQAGAFSPFTATFFRNPQEQELGGVSVTTPPGLLGILRGVERCPEPQASQGTCGPNSLIGHTTVAAGAGPNPFYVQGGQVFLTGPYKGAPFGLSFVVPAVAGPFNLGNVIVRAAIDVDPHTAQITVVSDSLPRILDGIPLDVRTVNVTIDRQGFLFNPTNCEPLTVGGSLTSTQGASAQVSSHFQAANCANLPFHPVFTVSTQAKTSKHNGASLTVRTTYPPGVQANIRSVAVVLPKQLPARLTTIQQACPEATLAANPASCPAGSDIGVATATTPVLSSPLAGPAYLVSHGGAAFPDVDIVFQGEGVTLDLVGSVNIKHGITTSKFATVPDAPIGSFQLSLPEGPHSGLAAVLPAKAKGNMCAQKLTMPFTVTAQNGAVLNQNVKIAVTGCPKPKAKKRKRAKAKRKG